LLATSSLHGILLSRSSDCRHDGNYQDVLIARAIIHDPALLKDEKPQTGKSPSLPDRIHRGEFSNQFEALK